MQTAVLVDRVEGWAVGLGALLGQRGTGGTQDYLPILTGL